MTGDVPFPDLRNDLQVSMAIINGQVPRAPLMSSDEEKVRLWIICKRCWETDPSDRPSTTLICNSLSEGLPNETCVHCCTPLNEQLCEFEFNAKRGLPPTFEAPYPSPVSFDSPTIETWGLQQSPSYDQALRTPR